MIRVTAPGLPPLPKLWFDPHKRQAKVAARHPTWRSHEWAIRLTEVTIWLTNGLLAWLIWPYIPDVGEPLFRIVLFLLMIAFVGCITAHLLRETLREFLARQIFATRTVLLFTPEAIVVRSHLYEQPVVIWRMWNGQPVKGRFALLPDADADKYRDRRQGKRKAPQHHLSDAKLLALVLSTENRRHEIGWNDQHNSILRSVPITQISERLAARFTMVYAAAAALTSPKQSSQASSGDGIDIDDA